MSMEQERKILIKQSGCSGYRLVGYVWFLTPGWVAWVMREGNEGHEGMMDYQHWVHEWAGK